MNKKELLQETENTIEEVDTLINNLKKSFKTDSEVIDDEKEQMLTQLEDLKEKISLQVDNVREIKDEETKQVSEIEKNIYSDIRSFHEAFTEAGSIFR